MRLTGLLLLAGIIGISLPAAADTDTQRVGVMLCQTGSCADWGTAALRGAELAAEQINAAGGVLGKKLELLVEDTNESVSGAHAVTAFQSLLARDIKLFVGPSWSPGALSVLPIAKSRSDIVVITPSAAANEFSRGAPHLFNIRPHEDACTKALAEYFYNQGKRRAAIFSSVQPATIHHGELFEAEFKRLGGEVSIRVEPDAMETDLKTEALKIVRSKPDVIFVMNYLQIEAAAQALNMLGSTVPRGAISIDDARVKKAGGLLEGMIVARSPEPTDEFKAAFRARFNEAPGLSAEGGYDAVTALADAAIAASTFDAAKVAGALQNGKHSGAIGNYSFDAARQVEQKPVMLIVQRGQLRTL